MSKLFCKLENFVEDRKMVEEVQVEGNVERMEGVSF
jgi:hypothetical protein